MGSILSTGWLRIGPEKRFGAIVPDWRQTYYERNILFGNLMSADQILSFGDAFGEVLFRGGEDRFGDSF
jgi:hypothetical protein